jgi:hypothetical protein
VFAAGFGVLYSLLMFNSRWLFTTVMTEGGDFAANSIITHQAKHFELLVGNYSRMQFSHPGPAYFYVQAFGEWLCHDILGIVPSPGNGQVLAVLALNSALVAAALVVLSRWLRSWLLVGVAATVMLAYFAAHGALLSSNWMPYMYFAPFLLLLTAGASVAAGRAGDLWAVALAGSFLVHGHASFLLLVPVIAVIAVVLHLRQTGIRGLREHRGDWLLAGGVIGLFLLPIVINLALHWPGPFSQYFRYGSSDNAGGHSIGEAVRFATRFWPGRDGQLWPGQPGPHLPAVTATPLIIMLVIFAGLGAVAWWHRKREIGRYQRSAVIMGVVATGLVIVYAARGIDDLNEEYTALFSYAVPLLLLVLIATGVVTATSAVDDPRPTGRAGRRVVLPALVGGLTLATAVAAGMLAPSLRATPGDHIANVAPAMDLVRARTAGAPALLELQQEAWPTMTALLIQGQRTGQRVCVVDEQWTFMVTTEFVCGPAELRAGTRFLLSVAEDTPPGVEVLIDFAGPGPVRSGGSGPVVLSTPEPG